MKCLTWIILDVCVYSFHYLLCLPNTVRALCSSSSGTLEFYDFQQLVRCGCNDHSRVSMDSATCATLYLSFTEFSHRNMKKKNPKIHINKDNRSTQKCATSQRMKGMESMGEKKSNHTNHMNWSTTAA